MILNHTVSTFEVGIGLAAILFFGEKFYALGPGQRPREQTRNIPKWLGRTWFIGIGLILMCWGLLLAVGTWNQSDRREAFRLAGGTGAILLISFVASRFRSRFAAGRGLFSENTLQRLFPNK